MKNEIISNFEGKSIAILGFGKEGRSTYQFIRRFFKDIDITILDKENIVNDEVFLGDNHVKFVSKNYFENLDKYDIVMKSPGVSLKDIDTSNVNISSQIEMVIECFKDKVIGITGTKGKSTTTSLIYNILKENGKDAVLAGNIGIPVFDVLDNVNGDTYIVLEISSHQLEFLKISPHIGVVLNLFEDHLDHAGSIIHYHDIKMNMFKYQNSEDYMIYCSDNDTLRKLVLKNDYKGHKYDVSLSSDAYVCLKNGKVYCDKQEVFDSSIKRNLLGIHNFENIMVAFLVSRLLKLDDNITLKAISNFQALDYRLQYIGSVKNVKYYVDTLATIPSATIEAIEAIGDVNTLIFGGMDRGISYKGFSDYLKKTNIEHFICMPTTGHAIGKYLPIDRVYFVDSLKEACDLALEVTKEGTSCVLSPAAASYEQFKNYAEKGDKFKEYILK